MLQQEFRRKWVVKFFVVKKEQNLLLTKNQPTLEKSERKYIKIKLQRAKNCYSCFLLRHKINKLILIRSTCIRVYDKSQIILNSNYSGSYIGSSVFGTDDRNISLEFFYVLLFLYRHINFLVLKFRDSEIYAQIWPETTGLNRDWIQNFCYF